MAASAKNSGFKVAIAYQLNRIQRFATEKPVKFAFTCLGIVAVAGVYEAQVTHKGKLTDEVKSYLDFTTALFKCWKSAKHNKDKTLYVCPEMGPYHQGGAGYNITGLSPAWPDAAILRGELDKSWKRAK